MIISLCQPGRLSTTANPQLVVVATNVSSPNTQQIDAQSHHDSRRRRCAHCSRPFPPLLPSPTQWTGCAIPLHPHTHTNNWPLPPPTADRARSSLTTSHHAFALHFSPGDCRQAYRRSPQHPHYLASRRPRLATDRHLTCTSRIPGVAHLRTLKALQVGLEPWTCLWDNRKRPQVAALQPASHHLQIPDGHASPLNHPTFILQSIAALARLPPHVSRRRSSA